MPWRQEERQSEELTVQSQLIKYKQVKEGDGVSMIDKFLLSVNPGAAARRAESRLRYEKMNMQIAAAQGVSNTIADFASNAGSGVTNYGYSHGAASKRKTWAAKWNTSSGSAKRDIEENRKTLRERSRDLAMNAPLGAAAINSTRTSCVGSGLVPAPKLDYDFLGISKEEAKEIERQIKREWSLWADSTLCDNNDQNNFYELQQIAFNDWLRNGEEFVLIKYAKKPDLNMPYQLRIKLVEADRVRSPDDYSGDYSTISDRITPDGNRIMNGVEIDKEGRVIAYHIASFYPGEYLTGDRKWTRVPRRGKQTGNPNILHIFNADRADQYRGVPFLAPVIESLKQLTRYTDAEIMAALINAMFTIFITTENGEGVGYGGEDGDLEEEDDQKDDDIVLGSGTINELRTGEKVQTVESTHPSGNFDQFVNAFCNHIGAALEIAPEVLLKKFSKSFSASKGALNETWKSFKMRRKWFVDDFCKQVYELWFSEAVSKGRIPAPGYFNNPLIKAAYLNAKWNGPAQGQLNPEQEVAASILKIENGFSTHEDECAAMNGSSFEDNVRALTTENEQLFLANEKIEKTEE